MNAALYRIDVTGILDGAFIFNPGTGVETYLDLGGSEFRWSFQFIAQQDNGRISLHNFQHPFSRQTSAICDAPPPGVEPVYSVDCSHIGPVIWLLPTIGTYEFEYAYRLYHFINAVVDLDLGKVEMISAGFSPPGTPYSLGLEWNTSQGSKWNTMGRDPEGRGYIVTEGAITSVGISSSTPIPEPSTLAMAAPILLGFLGWRRLRSHRYCS